MFWNKHTANLFSSFKVRKKYPEVIDSFCQVTCSEEVKWQNKTKQNYPTQSSLIFKSNESTLSLEEIQRIKTLHVFTITKV